MIDWSKGIVARYYATVVNPVTWNDVTELEITDGSIRYSDVGERATADISCRNFDYNNEYWIRLYMTATQDGDSERIPLFTGIASVPNITYKGRKEENKLQCYSALSLADKVYLPLGWYLDYGVNGAAAVKDILSDAVPAPIVIDDFIDEDDIPIITQRIVAEENETKLTMADKILDAIGWRMLLDGNGMVHISPYASDPVALFDYRFNDIFEMDVSISNNWYDIPNVYRAIGEGISAVAKDEDPNSRFSIQNRGREIWASESGVILANNEKISDYAAYKLKEAQKIYKTLDYTRRFDPNVRVSDLVTINYLEQGISGIFEVRSQTLTIGYGGQVSEQSEGL